MAQEQRNEAENALPTWDLKDLYDAMDSPTLQSDFEESAQKAEQFAQNFQGRLGNLSGDELASAISTYEAISETLGRISSYAQLLYAGDISNTEIGQFYQTCSERITDITSGLIFFTLELNNLSDDFLDGAMASSEALRAYSPWIQDSRAFKPHQLSQELESLMHEKSLSSQAWMRLFDETLADLRFPFGDQDKTITEIMDKIQSRDGKDRKEAAQSIGQTLGQNIRTFALITNTLARDKAINDKWRHFDRPVSSRNLSNLVEDEVVDALVSSVQSHYPSLSHRYYAIKAKWMGVDKMDYWDRLAPLPDEDDSFIPWEKAQDIVLDAYGRFSPELAGLGQKFFDAAWIDASVRQGKASGAFAHPTVPSAHPYLLVNFQGKTRDVMTLAHELGHGVHQLLAAEQGYLMSSTPLTLAETASVFGEMLTFKGLLASQSDPKIKRALLASKIEDMLNTVVRQIAFYEFERRVHDARKNGELTPEHIGDIWLECSRESLGDIFEFGPEFANYWAYIPHFIHSPFYVYAYAFGDCLVNSLYALYEESHPGFVEKYFDMLKAGGSMRHKELLAPFGLDASDPAFWNKGLSVIEGFIDELENSFE